MRVGGFQENIKWFLKALLRVVGNRLKRAITSTIVYKPLIGDKVEIISKD